MTITNPRTTNLISRDKMNDAGSPNEMDNALAHLMLAIRGGRRLAISRVTTDSLDRHALSHKAAYVRLEWLDPDDRHQAVVSVQCASRMWTEHVPDNGPSVPDVYSTLDKLIDAVQYQYDIRTFVNDAGDAVLAWNRASHGNRPAVVLREHDIVETYYDAPEWISQRLEADERERYQATTADAPYTLV